MADTDKDGNVRTRYVCCPVYDQRHLRIVSHACRTERHGTASAIYYRPGWAGARRVCDSGSRWLETAARWRSLMRLLRLPLWRLRWATEAYRNETSRMTTMMVEWTSCPYQQRRCCLQIHSSKTLSKCTC